MALGREAFQHGLWDRPKRLDQARLGELVFSNCLNNHGTLNAS
jgi:hypothetical protein